MSKVVFDTDVLIEFLRGRDAARAFLLDVTRDAIPCCSVITVAELHAGMRPEESEPTGALLDGLEILPVTRRVAEVAGRFKKASSSRRLELADCLIAATAFLEGAAVATGDARDYPMREVTVLAVPR